jgi:hypothetical protein
MFKRSITPALAIFAAVVGVLACSVSAAFAYSPAMTATTLAEPKHLPPGGEGKIVVQVTNLGDESALGETTPIVITDTLPEGLEATEVSSVEERAVCAHGARVVRCEYHSSLVASGEPITVEIPVRVSPGATGSLVNEVRISGGNTTSVVSREPVTVSSAPVPVNGLEKATLLATNENGTEDTVAGSHPFQLTSTIVPNTLKTMVNGKEIVTDLPKDIRVNLPAGLLGNTNVVAQCGDAEFNAIEKGNVNACAPDTAIGTAQTWVSGYQAAVPLFNLTPSPGEPARFGFTVIRIPIIIDTSVRTGRDYGVVASINNIQQLKGFEESQVSFWGTPAARSHNPDRGWACLLDHVLYGELYFPCEEPANPVETPFLTLPTACSGAAGLTATANANSWLDTEFPLEEVSFTPAEGLNGCNRLPFDPSVKAVPDGQQASSPTGLTVDVHQPQSGTLNPEGVSSADVKDIKVTLPEGVVVNPAGADGLQACSESQIGFTGFAELDPSAEAGVKTAQFTPEEQSCPAASKIGEATIHTPLLPNPLTGAVYLATQNANPFGSLIAFYLVARDPVSGVLVKVPAEVSLNQANGQLTTTLENSPQVPFEDAELHFFGGARAPLATPAHCGTYTTSGLFGSWAAGPEVENTSSFEVTSGPGGSACPGGSLPFAPSLTADMVHVNAGAFSEFTSTITREDGNQNIQQVTLHLPPGLSGVLTGVPLCAEAQANAGTCSQASLIGHTIVSVGLGSDPYSVTGGEVFLTEKVAGSSADQPFGLSIVNPAVAGPFNLGKVIVRATIEVDPHTAQLTVATTSIPHILDGIPLQIKHVNVTIDRPGFTFNPTNCNPQQVTGSVASVEGASAPVSEPFQVTNCATLKFAPKFAVSTAGKSTRSGGASLKVKLTYPTGAGYANIKAVKVDLPKQLPSRLTTLQKACLAKVFEANPANCPKESIVGTAKAITPILPVPLEGPAYFVSYGNEKFPALIVVLQGYGVTVDLVGTTFISHAGITSSTFKTVPDVPVGTFELTLPTGKFSALAANLPTEARSSFCGQSLAMPTAFVAQNGLEIHESTKIGVSGCAKKASTKKSAKKSKKAKKGK